MDRPVELVDNRTSAFFGAPMPNQTLTSYPGSVWETVGTSGSAAQRTAVVIARARMPALIPERQVGVALK